jgi:4-hydroxybenzoate polyprenyltransferase
MGWAAAVGSLAAAPIALYLAAVAWTIGYDTIYALQDIEDDETAGIKSSALLFGEHVRIAVAAFYALACALLLGALALAEAGLVAYAGAAVFAVHLAWQVARIDGRDGAVALATFRSNRDAGLILFAALSLDAWAYAGA